MYQFSSGVNRQNLPPVMAPPSRSTLLKCATTSHAPAPPAKTGRFGEI